MDYQARIQAAYDGAAKALADARALLARENLTAEDEAAAQRAMDDCEAKRQEGRRWEQMQTVETDLASKRLPTPAPQSAAAETKGVPPWMAARIAAAPGETAAIKAFDTMLRAPATLTAEQKAALAEGTDNTGGYLTPNIYTQDLVKALYNLSYLRSAGARIITLTSDNTRIATQTASSAAVLTTEANAYDEVEPTFGEVVFIPYKYTRLAKAADEVVADSRFDIWGNVLQPDFVQAFAAAENTAFTTGTGTNQPQGVVTGATTGVTAASATTIDPNELFDLFFALDYKYRPNARWMMNDATIKAIAKLTDAQDRYLIQPGLNGDPAGSLLGHPIVTNNSMATIAASAKVALFGDFSYFWIGDRDGLQIMRLNELYAGTGQVGFRAYKRFDSHVMLAAAIQLYIMHA